MNYEPMPTLPNASSNLLKEPKRSPEVEVEEEDDEGFLTRMSDKLDSDGGGEVSSGVACNDQRRQKG